MVGNHSLNHNNVSNVIEDMIHDDISVCGTDFMSNDDDLASSEGWIPNKRTRKSKLDDNVCVSMWY